MDVIKNIKIILEEGNKESKEEALITLSYFGSSFIGLQFLFHFNLIQFYLSFIKDENYLIVLINSLTFMLNNLIIKEDQQNSFFIQFQFNLQNIEINNFKKENIINIIMTLIKQPFDQINNSCFGLLNILSTFKWGILLQFNYPGFFEFIINRESHLKKEGSFFYFFCFDLEMN
jgi:hypothetical protein